MGVRPLCSHQQHGLGQLQLQDLRARAPANAAAAVGLAPITYDLEMHTSASSFNDDELASKEGISNDPHKVVRSFACV